MSEQNHTVAAAFKAAALRQRVITALIIGCLFLTLVLEVNLVAFEVVLAAVFLIAAWEWSALAGLHFHWQRIVYLVLMLVVAVLLQHFGAIIYLPLSHRMVLPDFAAVRVLMQCAVGFWILALLAVLTYPASKRIWGNHTVRALIGYLLLLPAWAGLVVLKQQHPGGLLVLWVVAIIALADIGAYFAGVAFGSHKLAPAISPGKSWEGVAGGLIANLLFAAGLYFYLGLSSAEFCILVIVHAMVTMASVVGDLFESMIKRHQGVKDSGTLLPGHGGILDRIDGWLAAVPVFTLAYLASAMWS